MAISETKDSSSGQQDMTNTTPHHDVDSAQGGDDSTITEGGGKGDTIPIRTSIRRVVLPLLPPPIVRGIRHVDPLLAPHVGDVEPSMTILGSLLLAYMLFQVLKLATGRKAIVDDDEEQLAKSLQGQSFSNTVVLLGPSQAGKTRLFYHLCHGVENNPTTVISLRPNAGFSNDTRFMDYPGHLALSALPADVFQNSNKNNCRILFLLDATKPVSDNGGEVFLQLVKSCRSSRPVVLVMCHQSDKAGSKNPKRLRLSLRTEVERLLKVSPDDTILLNNKPLVLEELADIAFVATSIVDGTGMDTVQAFIKDGVLPEPTTAKR